MNKRKTIAITILQIILLSLNVIAQESVSNDRTSKANEILEQSRNAIYGKSTNNRLKSISIKYLSSSVAESTTDVDELKDAGGNVERIGAESSTELLIQFPSMISSSNKTELSGGNDGIIDTIGSYSLVSTLLNGEKYKSDNKIFINGKEFNRNKSKSGSMPSSFLPQKKQLTTAEKRESFLNNLWLTTFPILLDSPWGEMYTFEFIGKAESPDGRADVIDAKSSDSKKIELFFDEKTHLLLMTTVKNDTDKEGIKGSEDTKYFFSNYETVDGVLIAKKINIESLVKTVMDKTVLSYKLKGGSRKTTTEITIKEVKINPVFKSDSFLIKDEAK